MTSLAFDLPQEDGRACAVRVAAPPGLMPAGGWPVAYVLDLKQFDRMRADPGGLPGLLVGLGPGVPEDRRWDYVPAGMSPDMGQSPRTAPCLTNPNIVPGIIVPVGIVTSLVGVPFFLAVVLRRQMK